MVHKKSEYRLTYKWLPADIKHEILKISANNLDYRVQRRQRDQSHHPFEWHLVDGQNCECDVSDEGDRFLPIPPVRQKHNMLVEEWMTRKGNIRGDHQVEKCKEDAHFQHSDSEKAIHDYNARINHTIRSHGEARYSPLPIDAAACVTNTDRGALPNRLQHQMNNDTDVLKNPIEKLQSSRIKDYFRNKERGEHNATSHRLNICTSDRAAEAKNPRRVRTDVVPVVPKPPVIIHRPSSVTKRREVNGSRSLIDKKPPFHSYGWANSVNAMGKQHTHNTRVQSNEVHPSALLAKKIRNELSQPNLINFARKSKSISNLANIGCPIDYDKNQWTTEYQRNFSINRCIGD